MSDALGKDMENFSILMEFVIFFLVRDAMWIQSKFIHFFYSI